MRPNVDDTGVMVYEHIQSGFQYYHNVDTGSLVVHRKGKPFLRFAPQCLLSVACFLDWVDDVANVIRLLDENGVLYND